MNYLVIIQVDTNDLDIETKVSEIDNENELKLIQKLSKIINHNYPNWNEHYYNDYTPKPTEMYDDLTEEEIKLINEKFVRPYQSEIGIHSICSIELIEYKSKQFIFNFVKQK